MTLRSSEVMHCLKEEFEIIPSAYNGKPEIAQVLGYFGFICITHLVFLQPNYTSSGRQVKKKSYSDDAVDCDYAVRFSRVIRLNIYEVCVSPVTSSC